MSTFIHRPAPAPMLVQTTATPELAPAAVAEIPDAASLGPAGSSSPPEGMHRPPVESMLYVRPQEGTHIPSFAEALLKGNRLRASPRTRIVINTQSWAEPLGIDVPLEGALAALADAYGTALCLKTAAAPYAVECLPATASPLLASGMMLLAGPDVTMLSKSERRELTESIEAKEGRGKADAFAELKKMELTLTGCGWDADMQMLFFEHLLSTLQTKRAVCWNLQDAVVAVLTTRYYQWDAASQFLLLSKTAAHDQDPPFCESDFQAVVAFVDQTHKLGWTTRQQQEILLGIGGKDSRNRQAEDAPRLALIVDALLNVLQTLAGASWNIEQQLRALHWMHGHEQVFGADPRYGNVYAIFGSCVEMLSHWSAAQQYEHLSFLMNWSLNELYADLPGRRPARASREALRAAVFGFDGAVDDIAPKPTHRLAGLDAFLAALFFSFPDLLRELVDVMRCARETAQPLAEQVQFVVSYVKRCGIDVDRPVDLPAQLRLGKELRHQIDALRMDLEWFASTLS